MGLLDCQVRMSSRLGTHNISWRRACPVAAHHITHPPGECNMSGLVECTRDLQRVWHTTRIRVDAGGVEAHAPGMDPPAMASRRASSAPPVGSSIVPYEAPLTCVGCGKNSQEVMWGQHKITYSPDRSTILAKKCTGSGCMSCRDTAWLAQLPSNPKWEEVGAQLREDEKARTTFSEWTSRRFGEKVPRYARQSVEETIKSVRIRKIPTCL